MDQIMKMPLTREELERELHTIETQMKTAGGATLELRRRRRDEILTQLSHFDNPGEEIIIDGGIDSDNNEYRDRFNRFENGDYQEEAEYSYAIL